MYIAINILLGIVIGGSLTAAIMFKWLSKTTQYPYEHDAFLAFAIIFAFVFAAGGIHLAIFNYSHF